MLEIYCYIQQNTIFVLCACNSKKELCAIILMAKCYQPKKEHETLTLILDLNATPEVNINLIQCAFHDVTLKIKSEQTQENVILLEIPTCSCKVRVVQLDSEIPEKVEIFEIKKQVKIGTE